jgi:16S rRNA (guanine1207-N2)-methyltransferase
VSRWRDDPERAAEALGVAAIEAIAAGGRVLLIDPGPHVVAAARARWNDVAIWCRRAGGVADAHVDPPSGPFDTALARLPKAKDEWVMCAHQAAAVSGGSLMVYGGNDEGIRSAAKAVASRLPGAETVAVGGHGRIVQLAGPQARVRGRAVDWRLAVSLTLPGAMAQPWVTYPGLFAGGALDDGTSMLINAVVRLPPAARVLDYGCGTGVVAAALIEHAAATHMTVLDADSVALLATGENVPSAVPLLAHRLPTTGTWDRIISNPPIHVGIAEDHRALNRLIADAPARLSPDGDLVIVVQSRLAIGPDLERAFALVEVLAADRRFRVWRASMRR